MAKILKVYETYQIMPILQEHQFRVAAVGKLICDNLTVPVDASTVITALLLHDMGNIIKFDLNYFPDTLKPQGMEYWQVVQGDYFKKYGKDEHKATVMIAKELGVSNKVIECIDSISFYESVKNASGNNIEAQICDIADLRVAPYGIVSLDERLEDGNKRYKNRPDKWMSDEQRKILTDACHKIEDNVFAVCKIKPADITDQSVKPIVDQLQTYVIS